MKKTVLLLVALLLVSAVLPTLCFAEGTQPAPVRVFVDKKLVSFPDIDPFINEEGRTMVPVRFVSDKLGSTTDWNGAAQAVTLRRGDKTVILVIGNDFARVNGKRVEFGTKAQIAGGRTMVPLRFISETFGAGVDWDGAARTVYITTGTDKPPPPAARKLLTLYFPDEGGQYLVPEQREVVLTKPVDELIFDALLAGPQQADRRRAFPPAVRYHSLIIDRGVAYLNLNSRFCDEYTGDLSAEQLTLYSIVNSLTELPEIDCVQFLLDGGIRETILGGVNTARPLTPRPDLVKYD